MDPNGTEKRRPVRGAVQLQLTKEEIQVLKDCRVNSVYYRGLPLGILSAVVARGALQSGYFPRLKRWSGLFYTGMFGLGFFSGIASYRQECFRKIMALENSVLAEQLRDFQRKTGLPVTNSLSSEFESSPDADYDSATTSSQSRYQDSPLMERMTQKQRQLDSEQTDAELTSRWTELRQQSRQARVSSPATNDRGLSYEELKKRNNLSHSSSEHNTSELHVQKDPSKNFDSYRSSSYFDDKKSSALDFSRDVQEGMPILHPKERGQDGQKNDINNRPRKSYVEAHFSSDEKYSADCVEIAAHFK